MGDTGASISNPIILYDGECGLCDRFVQFVLRHDRQRLFHFAALQSELGRSLQLKHGIDPGQLRSVVLIESGRAMIKSTAALRVLVELDGLLPLLGFAAYVPISLRDAVYDWIADHRKRFFKAPTACVLPAEADRERFHG